jgi:hypothetical protein
VALSVIVYELGRRGIFPGTFDENGVAVSFASDGVRYRAGAAALSEALKHGELLYWVGADHAFHVKLYSICFALFGRGLGLNVLGAEPLNLLCYLACLSLIFIVGREVFERRVGLLAAVAVALWPSFLLHTTQFLKDPLFVSGMLALILFVLRWMMGTYSWARASATGIGCGLIIIALWLTRADMGEILIATVLLGALMLAAGQLVAGRVRAPNLAAMALVVVVTLAVPLVMPDALKLGRSPSSITAPTPGKVRHTHPWWKVAARVGNVRRRFINRRGGSASDIDRDVEINGTVDLLRYLPRAMAVGFFAPFPDMWLAPGDMVGSAGRLLAGVESLAMYFVEGLALLGLWRGRRRISAWFLFSVAAMGMTALGLVVVNVGTLYRLRYVFLVFLIILAADGAAHAFDRLSKERSGSEEGSWRSRIRERGKPAA